MEQPKEHYTIPQKAIEQDGNIQAGSINDTDGQITPQAGKPHKRKVVLPPVYRGLQADGCWAYGRLTVVEDTRQWLKKVDAGYYISNWEGAPLAYKVIPETVGILTPSKDAAGDDIYVGDKIQTVKSGGFDTWTVCIGGNGCFVCKRDVGGFGLHYLNTIASMGVVIGNIHEVDDV